MREFEIAFRQVIACGIGSSVHQDLVKTCQKLTEQFARQQRPLTRSVINKFNRKQETNVRFVGDLGLKIQVQLQPYHSPTNALTRNVDDGGLSPNPMKIWVVDITKAPSTGRTPGLSPNPMRRLRIAVAVSLVVVAVVFTVLMVH